MSFGLLFSANSNNESIFI